MGGRCYSLNQSFITTWATVRWTASLPLTNPSSRWKQNYSSPSPQHLGRASSDSQWGPLRRDFMCNLLSLCFLFTTLAPHFLFCCFSCLSLFSSFPQISDAPHHGRRLDIPAQRRFRSKRNHLHLHPNTLSWVSHTHCGMKSFSLPRLSHQGTGVI